jgi:DNA-binding transcriptional MerR regulator
MVSSKDIEVKKFAKRFRGFSRELITHLCAESDTKEDTIFLLLAKVMKQFWPLVRGILEEKETPSPLEDQNLPDLENRFGSKLFRQLYHDALDIAFDVKFGNLQEFKKGTPGRKSNAELAKRIWTLQNAGVTSREIRALLKTEGKRLTLSGVEAYRKTRRKNSPQ